MDQRPLPKITDVDAPFWKGCNEQKLMLPKCKACGHIFYPPYASCPKCAFPDPAWVRVSGKGQVWGWVEMNQPYLPYYRDHLPYNVVLVKLAEGPFMYSNVVNAKYEDLKAGLPLEVVFERIADNVTIPKFKLV